MSKSSTVKTLRHFESDADLNIDEIESPPAPPLADLRRFQSNAPRLSSDVRFFALSTQNTSHTSFFSIHSYCIFYLHDTNTQNDSFMHIYVMLEHIHRYRDTILTPARRFRPPPRRNRWIVHLLQYLDFVLFPEG